MNTVGCLLNEVVSKLRSGDGSSSEFSSYIAALCQDKEPEVNLFYILTRSIYFKNPEQEELIQNAFISWIEDSQNRSIFNLDLNRIVELDPACSGLTEALMFYKGFIALIFYRISHKFWSNGDKILAREINAIVSFQLGVDIHPGAKIGTGLFMDHATGVVIGETAVIGDYVSIFHGVTLGGTGKRSCMNRHPTIGDNVILSAYCSILGNVYIGSGCKVAASSVVLQNFPPNTTVAGIPAKIVRVHNEIPNKVSEWDFKLA